MTDTEQKRIKAICKLANIDDISDLSDGFHTFKQLYYQRMMLFAVLVKQNRDNAWKSLRHEDGELCFGGGWFIVGIDTPEGSYTYHYEDNYFSLFDCEELEIGKHWDGHTEKDVTRLLSLGQAPCEDSISRSMAINKLKEHYFDKELQSAKDDPCIIDARTDLDIRIIKALPPVTPAQKKGKWIKCGTEEKIDHFGDKVEVTSYRCSECGRLLEDIGIYGWTNRIEEYPYCHCGAKMESKE